MPLMTTKEMFRHAYANGYAIGAFHVNTMETIQGIVAAGKELDAPLILQVSAGARKYANPIYLKHLVDAAVEESGLPIFFRCFLHDCNYLHVDKSADPECYDTAYDCSGAIGENKGEGIVLFIVIRKYRNHDKKPSDY